MNYKEICKKQGIDPKPAYMKFNITSKERKVITLKASRAKFNPWRTKKEP